MGDKSFLHQFRKSDSDLAVMKKTDSSKKIFFVNMMFV